MNPMGKLIHQVDADLAVFNFVAQGWSYFAKWKDFVLFSGFDTWRFPVDIQCHLLAGC